MEAKQIDSIFDLSDIISDLSDLIGEEYDAEYFDPVEELARLDHLGLMTWEEDI